MGMKGYAPRHFNSVSLRSSRNRSVTRLCLTLCAAFLTRLRPPFGCLTRLEEWSGSATIGEFMNQSTDLPSSGFNPTANEHSNSVMFLPRRQLYQPAAPEIVAA